MDHQTIESGGIILGILGVIAATVAGAGVAIGKLFRRVDSLEKCAEKTVSRVEAVEQKNAEQDTTSAVILERIDSMRAGQKGFSEELARQTEIIIEEMRK